MLLTSHLRSALGPKLILLMKVHVQAVVVPSSEDDLLRHSEVSMEREPE